MNPVPSRIPPQRPPARGLAARLGLLLGTWATLWLPATGCQSGVGGGDVAGIDAAEGPPPGVIDAMPRADARPPAPDAKVADCPPGLPDQFGDLGFQTSTKNSIGGPDTVYVYINGNQDQFLIISADPGRGLFKDGVVPGTYTIQGMDTDYQVCALCVYMFADYPQPPSLHLMAEKGQVTIDSVNGDQLSGSIKDVSFRPIEIVYDDQSTSCTGSGDDEACTNTICINNHCGRQSNLDGCHTAISAMSF